jgi:hypothetical protein
VGVRRGGARSGGRRSARGGRRTAFCLKKTDLDDSGFHPSLSFNI